MPDSYFGYAKRVNVVDVCFRSIIIFVCLKIRLYCHYFCFFAGEYTFRNMIHLKNQTNSICIQYLITYLVMVKEAPYEEKNFDGYMAHLSEIYSRQNR